MKGKSILYISSELFPYFEESPISKKTLIAPKEMLKKGNDIRIFIPKYGFINERRYQLHEVIRLSGMNLVINDIDQPLIIKVASIPGEKIQSYFIDNDEYFKRKSAFSDENNEFYSDNDERAIFFARGVLETIKKLNWKPDIIHVHGWLAGLVPLYLKKFYKNEDFFADTLVATSLFNDSFEAKMNLDFINKLKFDGFDDIDIALLENPTYENLIQTSITHSDLVLKGEDKLPASVCEMLALLDVEVHDSCADSDIYESYSSIYQHLEITTDN
jgi:starch synthase